MVNFCLKEEEKNILKSLIGKKLIKYRRDPLDKFKKDTVYGRVELFFDDVVILINYDYETFPLFGNNADDRPKFSIKIINEEEALFAFHNIYQINIDFNEILKSITLVEDYSSVERDDKKDDVRILTAIILKFEDEELTFQGDYMIPLMDIIKGENTIEKLSEAGEEFKNDPETKFTAIRFLSDLK